MKMDHVVISEGQLEGFSADGEFGVYVKEGKAHVVAITSMFIHHDNDNDYRKQFEEDIKYITGEDSWKNTK